MNRIILGTLLSSLVSTAFGILYCHQCQTLEYKTCRDVYDGAAMEGNLGECEDSFFCTKIKTIVKIRDSGYITGWERDSQVVTRNCEPKKGNKEGCIGWQNNGGITLKCYCGTNGCNSSRSLTPGITTVILSFLVSLLVFGLVQQH